MIHLPQENLIFSSTGHFHMDFHKSRPFALAIPSRNFGGGLLRNYHGRTMHASFEENYQYQISNSKSQVEYDLILFLIDD